MYSFASDWALTLVSVPTTGRAKQSRTTKESPTALPESIPMTSRFPPDLACIAIFNRARAEMWTLEFFRRRRRVRGEKERTTRRKRKKKKKLTA